MKTPEPLLFTMKSRHRIIVAISWDDRIGGAENFKERLRGGAVQHDLDISCFVYDAGKNYIDFVGPMAQDSMDQSGAIYHSGDDATGEGDGDDEFVTCELAGLPADVHSLVFVTEIRSNHVFGDVQAPSMRIADGMSNDNLCQLTMDAPQGKDKQACVMARLFRDPASPTGWKMQVIDEYPALDDVPDWGSYLPRYL